MKHRKTLFAVRGFFDFSGILSAIALSAIVSSNIESQLGVMGWMAIFYIAFSLIMRTIIEYSIHKD